MIVFLQETWLTSQELHILTSIDSDFHARAYSAMDVSSDVLRGRPHGGVAILWRKELGGCKIIETADKRLMCLEFTSNNNSILFINVYLPCDTSDNLDDFVFMT